MLKKLREKKTAKKIWITLAVILVPAFVLWGFSGALRDREQTGYVGIIFGRRISYLEFKDAVNAVKNRAIMQYGDKLPEVQKELHLEAQAWERLLLLYEAKRRRISSSDREVIEYIESYPFFLRDGNFDNKIYNETLQYVFRTQPREFEEQAREDIIIAKLYNQVTRNTAVTEDEIKKGYEKANQQVSINYIASLPADFKKDIQPSEEEVKDFYEKSSFRFKKPPSFNLDYVILDSEQKTNDFTSLLKSNKDFYQTAKDAGLEMKETGFIGESDPIPGIGWAPEVSNLISKLSIGENTPPVKTEKDFYILRLKEKQESYVPEFEKVKDQAKEILIEELSRAIAEQKIRQCLESGDFQKCSKEAGLKDASTDLFNFGSYIEGVGASDDFWAAAMELEEGKMSQVISAASGFYVIRLKEKPHIEEAKFQEEKAEFSKKLLGQKRNETFVKFLQDLKRKTQ